MKTTRPESQSLLRWLFHLGHHTLTCAVNANGRGSYDVCLMPHWNLSTSVVEPFHNAAAAFERHAEISLGLRAKGWTVVEHGATRSANAA